MNKEWDLSVMYSGLDDPAYAGDIKIIEDCIAALSALAEKRGTMENEAFLCEYIRLAEKFDSTTEKVGIYAGLRSSTNTSDVEALGAVSRLNALGSRAAAPQAAVYERISKMENLEDIIEKNDELREFKYYLTSIKKDGRYLLSAREEEIFARMSISGASAWENLHDSLTSTVKAVVEGRELTLSEVRNLAFDPDPKVRKAAYEAELACYKSIELPASYAIDNIKLQVINECKLRGYESPLDQSLKKSRMKRETLDALLEAMREYMPKFRGYFRAKAKALGYENGLPWYELFAPMGKKPDTKYTVEDARDYLVNVFSNVNSDICAVIEDAFDNGWIDFYPHEGKVGGAFDCGVPSLCQSRVLTNFDGAYTDIVTLAHELGHAFHDRQVFSNSILNQSYSMPVAETASTFNETVVNNYAIDHAESDEVRLNLLEALISDAAQIICDIYSRFLFEQSVFDNCRDSFLDPNALCELMLKAQKEAYGDGLDPEYLHPYMWLCKGHYYSGSFSFYNYPYAFGGLFARGLYAMYLERGAAFFDDYKRLLNGTGTSSVEDSALTVGIDLTDKRFWEQGLESVAGEIDKLCGMLEK